MHKIIIVNHCEFRLPKSFFSLYVRPAGSPQQFGLITFFRHEIGPVTLCCQLLCLSLAAHTPDNSFMGFVAEELNETERLNIQRNKVNNMAVVYGKEASMWKVSIPP